MVQGVRTGIAELTTQMACTPKLTIRILFPMVVSRQSLAKANSTAEELSPCLTMISQPFSFVTVLLTHKKRKWFQQVPVIGLQREQS